MYRYGKAIIMQGIRFKAYPTKAQKLTLSQWMGCARLIWNAKCEDDRYYSTFAKKYLPVGTYAPVDQKYSQYKNKELTPWLSKCPSQILRNSVSNWKDTYTNYLKGICGKPKRKPKQDKGSIHITNELFRFEENKDGSLKVLVGSKTNNIGYLKFKAHRNYEIPNSIYITKKAGDYFLSFSYAVEETSVRTDKEHFDHLKAMSAEELSSMLTGIDRGVAIPVQTNTDSHDLTDRQIKSMSRYQSKIKQKQKQLAKKKDKSSNRRKKLKHSLNKDYQKVANIRKDFSHKASTAIVNTNSQCFVLEDLKTKNMSKSAKGTTDCPGKNVKAKSGLNRSILNVGWHQFESYLHYKAKRKNKAIFKVSPAHTSQECSQCGHTSQDNRKSQSEFHCQACNYRENADKNASMVIGNRAIRLIQDSGTELLVKGKGTCIPKLTSIGRGANKSISGNNTNALTSATALKSCAVVKREGKRKQSSKAA